MDKVTWIIQDVKSKHLESKFDNELMELNILIKRFPYLNRGADDLYEWAYNNITKNG